MFLLLYRITRSTATAGLLSLASALTVFLTGCDRVADTSVAGSSEPPPAAAPAVANPFKAAAYNKDELFTEVTGKLGFEENPPVYPDGTYMAPEITPGAVAVLDYNNDGLLDILLVPHPSPMPWPEQVKASVPNRLFAQQQDGTFTEVPGAAGLAGGGFHHGVAVGDVNNDGFPDVYICKFGGPDQFFINQGDGTFVDATKTAGFLDGNSPVITSKDNWSSAASFFDFNGDGHLDLWVVHFATFDEKQRCRTTSTAAEFDYCGPHTFPGQLATLWQNNGDGTFTDITAKAGIAAPGRGWGIIAADLTGDGLADVFQANDEEPNQLWVNQGDGTFIDEALLRGCALNAMGSVEAGMGAAFGDLRNTGRGLDIFNTHFGGETNTVWQSQGDGLYADVTNTSGMALIDRQFTGWGCGFFDFDNDGFLDLAVVNGRVARGPVRPEANVGPFWNRFAEPNLLFRGDGSGRMEDASKAAGSFTRRMEVHRSLAFADLHNRGAIDLIEVNLDNTLRVHSNQAVPPGHNWVQVLPMIGKREALGAEVKLSAGGKTRLSLCVRAYSYLSSNDPRVHFGLGAATKVDSLEIAWPSGAPKRERFEVGEVNRVVKVQQGSGAAL